MQSSTKWNQTVYLDLSPVGIDHDRLLGYEIFVESKDTLENRTMYLSYGLNGTNCTVGKPCIVKGLYGATACILLQERHFSK